MILRILASLIFIAVSDSTTDQSPIDQTSLREDNRTREISPVLISSKSKDMVLRKRSTDKLELEADDCKDNTTFSSLNGTYEVYKMEQPEGVNWDEGENVTFACTVSYNTPYACFNLLEATVKSLSLVVNGVVQTEGDNLTTSSEHKSGDLYIYFHLILHYESHHHSDLMCSYQLSDTATLVSPVTKVDKVDELFEVKITPPSTTIKVGDSFTLTCHTDTHRALPHIRWSRQLRDGDSADKNIDCGEITANAEFTCLNSTNTPGSILIVRTIETEEFLEERYSYFCRAMSIVHSDQPQAETGVTVLAIDRKWIMILGLTGGAVVGSTLMVAVIIIVMRWKSRRHTAKSIRMTETRNAIMQIARTTSNEAEEERRATDAFMMAIETVNGIMDRISKKHSAWEKDKSKIQIKAQIGEGNFGVVLLGTMPNEFGIIHPVAIKTIKEQGIEVSALLDFEKEMEVMATLKHRNIVNLLGICTVSLPFYIIMEYMENGQLNDYLTKFAPSRDQPLGGLSVGQLAWMCEQPCDALEYLSANNMVHRDVSARNCLVGTNLQVKLADFGLSRNTSANDKNYYKKEGGMVPIKWMAPEALTFGRYTSANDVWAFGILAWEVFSFGALPYQHLTNQQVMVNICKGERLDRPHLCPEGLWEVLLKCWADKPDERIMFTAILAFLKEYSEEPSAVPNGGGETEFSIPHANTTVAY